MSGIKEELKNKVSQGGSQMRFTEGELNTIKSVFGGNDDIIKLLRKVFIPPYDPDAPLGQAMDLWFTMGGDALKEMPADDVKSMVIARNMLLQHLELQMIQLSVLANRKEESPEERANRLRADSTK